MIERFALTPLVMTKKIKTLFTTLHQIQPFPKIVSIFNNYMNICHLKCEIYVTRMSVNLVVNDKF